MAQRHDGVRNILIPVADPDLQIRGGGGGHPDPEIRGGPASKKMFSAVRASFSSENKGGWPPWVPPLVPPLHTALIGKAGTNVEVEPQRQPLDNERFNLRSAVTIPEARLDMKTGDFCSRRVTAFFDVRVTHVNSKCNQGKATSTIFKEQQEEKSGSTNRECWTLKWDLSLS